MHLFIYIFSYLLLQGYAPEVGQGDFLSHLCFSVLRLLVSLTFYTKIFVKKKKYI